MSSRLAQQLFKAFYRASRNPDTVFAVTHQNGKYTVKYATTHRPTYSRLEKLTKQLDRDDQTTNTQVSDSEIEYFTQLAERHARGQCS